MCRAPWSAVFPPTSSISSARQTGGSLPPPPVAARNGASRSARKSAGENNQGQRHFQRELRPRPSRAVSLRFRRSAQFRLERTTSSPTPRPASSVFTAAVENPGWNSISRRSRSVSRSAGFVRNQAALDRALLHAFVVDAAPVVFHFDVNVIAAMIGAQGKLCLLRTFLAPARTSGSSIPCATELRTRCTSGSEIC